MSIYRRFFFCLLLGQLISFCGDNESFRSRSSADSTNAAKKRAEQAEDSSDYHDCNEPFFSIASNLSDTTGLRLKLRNNRQVGWSQFVNDELMSSQVRWAVKNFDNDITDELVVSEFKPEPCGV